MDRRDHDPFAPHEAETTEVEPSDVESELGHEIAKPKPKPRSKRGPAS